MSISLMPTKGAINPPDAIDKQIAPQQASASIARYFTPRRASGIKAMMISALNMTAESTADSGVASA